MTLAEVAIFFCPEADFHTGTDLAGLVDDSKSIENPVEFLIDIGGDGKSLDGIQHDFYRSRGEFERWTMDYYRGRGTIQWFMETPTTRAVHHCKFLKVDVFCWGWHHVQKFQDA